MRLSGFDHVAFQVADLERSRGFYEAVLGMETFAVEARRVFLHCGRGILTLEHAEQQPVADGFHVGFVMAGAGEVEHWGRRLRAAGVRIEKEERGPGGCSLHFRDPDGPLLEIFWIEGE